MTSPLSSRIDVDLGERSYPIFIEPGSIDQAGARLQGFVRGSRLVVVSDETVWEHQGARLAAGLGTAGIAAEPVLLPPGEPTKNWEALIGLVDRLLDLGVERSDTILAFGGGVIGDLAGFAAAILKRGCGFIQIPTTLLAQVDSSVGGKTGINAAAGKNLVGAFHQPTAVLIDPSTLDTLPDRQLRAGYSEVVKYGLLGDAGFFAWCEANGGALIAGDAAARVNAIERSVAGKAAIVAADERELGVRALLNLGHTFGHALEAETGFSDRLLHGEAVALGMVLAFRLSAERGLCAVADCERVTRHLSISGLPVSLADAGIDASGETLSRHMLNDKKASGGRLTFILVHGIGQAFVDRSVTLDEVADFLDRQRDTERG